MRKLKNTRTAKGWGAAGMTIALLPVLVIGSGGASASTVTGLDFKGTSDPSVLEIRTDGPVQFEKRENADDRQVVIELPGAHLSSVTQRRIDTSSFEGNVLMVSPYAVNGQDASRIVVQLKKASGAEVTQDGNVIRVAIPRTATRVSSSSPSNPEAPSPEGAESGSQSKQVEGASQVEEGDSNGTGKLRSFVENQQNKTFTGKPITLQVRDMDAADVFRLIGEASGFNIVLADDVRGKVTLSLVDVPWDQALNVVLQTLQLGAERNNNILRITTLKNLTIEKMNEIRAAQAARAAAPRLTRIFPINYANLSELAKVLEKLQTSFQGADAGGSGLTNIGQTIVEDKRTNSLIVRDMPENLDRIEKLIKILDTQTPQVMIEAKVVEAREGTGMNLTGGGFAGLSGGTVAAVSFGSSGSPGADMLSTVASSSSGPQGALGISFFPSGAKVQALLTALQSEDKAKVVSSPKTVVLNKEKATVTQTIPTALQVTTFSGGVPTTAYQTFDAKIELNVVPQVANDGAVRLELDLSRDVVTTSNAQPVVAKRNMKTLVLVDSGNTLVIGGVHISDESTSSAGIPFLRNLPLIGALFSKNSESISRNELLFFITPSIINPKKAGFGA